MLSADITVIHEGPTFFVVESNLSWEAMRNIFAGITVIGVVNPEYSLLKEWLKARPV